MTTIPHEQSSFASKTLERLEFLLARGTPSSVIGEWVVINQTVILEALHALAAAQIGEEARV